MAVWPQSLLALIEPGNVGLQKRRSLMIRIDDWSVTVVTADPFVAPECQGQALHGKATNHPVLGTNYIRTSQIVGFKNRTVTTYSGSVYRLGRISRGFRLWLRKNRPNWNWRHPFTNLNDGSHELK